MWWIKIQEGYLGTEESQLYTRLPAQGSSAKKISPHNFWLQKPVGIESVEEISRVPSNSSSFFFPKGFIYLFLERREGREKRGKETSMCERNINWMPLAYHQPGTWPTT